MANITVGTKFRAVKSNLIGTVVKTDDKCKTAIIELEDGSNRKCCFGTLKDKRSWIPADEEVNTTSDIVDDAADNTDEAYVAEIMEQKKELGIECPPIESITVETVTCNTENQLDETLLSKFTKKEQKAIVMIYKGEDKLYHVIVDHNDHVARFDDKSLLRIGLAIREIVKGE